MFKHKSPNPNPEKHIKMFLFLQSHNLSPTKTAELVANLFQVMLPQSDSKGGEISVHLFHTVGRGQHERWRYQCAPTEVVCEGGNVGKYIKYVK